MIDVITGADRETAHGRTAAIRLVRGSFGMIVGASFNAFVIGASFAY